VDLRTRSGSRFPGAALVVIVFLVGACTSASAPGTASTSAGGVLASASPADVTSSPAASTGAGTGTGANPSNECSVVTKADVEAAFGGSSSAGKIDEHGHCAFEVSGAIHAGPNVSVPGGVGVSFGDTYTIYDTAKMLFGDSVTKVDGLGTEAWYALDTVHVKIAGGELAVVALWIGNFDKAIIQKDTITLAKAILARL
jgi:hypothetical protein